jgi:prepilin-type N-terminal cleavage/methylation domain-containing protein
MASLKLKKYRRSPQQQAEGFSLMEVLVATAIMGLVMVVLLEVLSAAIKAQESSWNSSQAVMVAEKVLEENCLLNKLAGGTYQGKEGAYEYIVRVTPQFNVSSPMSTTHVLCSAIQVTVTWRERGRSKTLVLGTVRTNAEKKS